MASIYRYRTSSWPSNWEVCSKDSDRGLIDLLFAIIHKLRIEFYLLIIILDHWEWREMRKSFRRDL